MRRTKPVLSTVIALATGALLVALMLMITAGCQGPVSPPTETETKPTETETKPEDTAGTTWTQVRAGGGLKSPAGTAGGHLRSVAWGAGRFVAVGDNGIIAHSVDGATWTEASATASEDRLLGVAWGGGRFVALVADGTIVHSADGASWQAASQDASGQRFDAVTYGGGRFLAVGREGTIAHSADGDRWQVANVSVASDFLFGVAWNGTRFVAVGFHDGQNQILYSDDGTTWTEVSATATTVVNLYGVAWGGTRFVAVGDRRSDRTQRRRNDLGGSERHGHRGSVVRCCLERHAVRGGRP